ncbi:MAG: hypothetical protein GC192_17700 [Bacteroidetes bacterium]|nr:hypothetical protein [Bacteroidota bacterium]
MLKKSVLLAILLAFAFTAVQAQKKGGHEFDPVKRAEKQTAMMTEKLGLSNDQVVKVKAINLKYAEKAKADFANKDAGDKAKMKEAHKAMRTEQQAELSKVFTKEQAAKWEQIKAERQGQGRGKMGGRPSDPTQRAERETAMMTEKLGLNADQAAKIKAINLKYAEKARANHDAANPSDDKSKKKAANRDLRKAHNAEISKVLTKDQAAKWEQMKAEQKAKRGEHGKQKGKPDKEGLKKG